MAFIEGLCKYGTKKRVFINIDSIAFVQEAEDEACMIVFGNDGSVFIDLPYKEVMLAIKQELKNISGS